MTVAVIDSRCRMTASSRVAVPQRQFPFPRIYLLIREIEEYLGAQVIDIPGISTGFNNYVSSCAIFII